MEQGYKPKFLLVLPVPPTACYCCCFSLKTGVYIIGVLDIIISVSQIIEALASIGNETDPFPGAEITISAFPFAILGMRGISRLNSEWVTLYSAHKQVEAVAMLVNAFLYALILCAEDCAVGTFVFVFSIPFILYEAYVVWSAEALLLMDKGAIAQGRRQVAELSESRGPFPPVYMPPEPTSV